MTLDELVEKLSDAKEERVPRTALPPPKPQWQDLALMQRLKELHEQGGAEPVHEMVSSAEHDIIYFNVDVVAVAKAASDDDIALFVAAGICYDDSFECFFKFV